MRAGVCFGVGGCKAVEDEQVAVLIVHGGEGGDAFDVEVGREGVHLIVFDEVPRGVPTGADTG